MQSQFCYEFQHPLYGIQFWEVWWEIIKKQQVFMFPQPWQDQFCLMISGVVQNDLHPLSPFHQNDKKSQEGCGVEHTRHHACEFSCPDVHGSEYAYTFICGILQYCRIFIFVWYPEGKGGSMLVEMAFIK